MKRWECFFLNESVVPVICNSLTYLIRIAINDYALKDMTVYVGIFLRNKLVCKLFTLCTLGHQ